MPPVFDLEKCDGCGACERFCPGDLIVLDHESSGKAVAKYPEECWHCGICRLECPEGAVSYRFPPEMAG